MQATTAREALDQMQEAINSLKLLAAADRNITVSFNELRPLRHPGQLIVRQDEPASLTLIPQMREVSGCDCSWCVGQRAVKL
jgi:hypothetical protein